MSVGRGGQSMIGAVDVVRLGAWCDLVTLDEYRAQLAGIHLDRASRDEAIAHFEEVASFRV